MEQDLISIVIPVYRAEQYIEETMDCVRAQTYADWELLLVEDCGPDRSRQMIEEYIQRTGEHRIRLLTHPQNLGAARARNLGVNEAKGRYLAFLDADDRFVNGKLQKQVAKLKETGADLCNTARRLIRADGTETETVIHTPEVITLSQLEHSNRINCSSVLVRRETALRFPMAHSDAHEDYLTWLHMLQNGVTMVGIDEPLLEYRLSESGKSRNKWKSAKMTYHTYRYAGYSRMKSVRLLVCYMINGVKKYIAH